jgi:peroxiredoxin
MKRLSRSNLLSLGVLAIVLGSALAIGLARQNGAQVELTGGAADNLASEPVKGALAPDFELTDLEGNQIRLSDLRGSPLLINFWATWCGPCRIEMPAIEARYQRYKDQGFRVLAVDFDEPADIVAEFRDELGLSFDILLDPGAKVQQLYRVRGYPSSYFVDRDGFITIVHIGLMTEGQLDDYLLTLELGP